MFELNSGNFEEEIIKKEGLSIVDFWSDTCEPCLALKPEFEMLANEFEGKVRFCSLETSKERRLAISQKVLGIPTVILYKNGEKIGEAAKEFATKENIRKLIESVI